MQVYLKKGIRRLPAAKGDEKKTTKSTKNTKVWQLKADVTAAASLENTRAWAEPPRQGQGIVILGDLCVLCGKSLQPRNGTDLQFEKSGGMSVERKI